MTTEKEALDAITALARTSTMLIPLDSDDQLTVAIQESPHGVFSCHVAPKRGDLEVVTGDAVAATQHKFDTSVQFGRRGTFELDFLSSDEAEVGHFDIATSLTAVGGQLVDVGEYIQLWQQFRPVGHGFWATARNRLDVCANQIHLPVGLMELANAGVVLEVGGGLSYNECLYVRASQAGVHKFQVFPPDGKQIVRVHYAAEMSPIHNGGATPPKYLKILTPAGREVSGCGAVTIYAFQDEPTEEMSQYRTVQRMVPFALYSALSIRRAAEQIDKGLERKVHSF